MFDRDLDPGKKLKLRWQYPNETGNDRGLGVDDLVLKGTNLGPCAQHLVHLETP